MLARHCTEAGLIEKAAGLWGKAGQRSLARSALVEAAAQLTRALDQIAALPGTPALRREQIKLQVALINALMHIRGYAAPETRAAIEKGRLLIEQAEALSEAPEDPLQLFSVLYSFWVANLVAFNGDVCLDIAKQTLALADKQKTTIPLLVGYRMMATSLLLTGSIAESCRHYDHAIELYEPAVHGPLAMRFGQEARVAILSYRSLALWLTGYPERALADVEDAVSTARSIGHSPSLLFALSNGLCAYTFSGEYPTANNKINELGALADEKGAFFWKTTAILRQGQLFALSGKPSEAVEMLKSGLTKYRSTGATVWVPMYSSYLAEAYAELDHLDDAWRHIEEALAAVKSTGERWWQAEVYRIAGELALKSPERDTIKAEAHFERALAIARQQQAKSWELRAAMSLARLWRDQGKAQEARQLLAPVYGWFTEGFDTVDLKEAKALLDELAA